MTKETFKNFADILIVLWIIGIIPYLWETIANYNVSVFEHNVIMLLFLIVRIVQFGEYK